MTLEARVARLLTIGTYTAVALIVVGTLGSLAAGRSPLDAAPSLELGRLPADLAALRPSGFLWLGVLGVIATPAARVAAALIGYLQLGERGMAVVAGLILVVIGAGVVAGIAAG